MYGVSGGCFPVNTFNYLYLGLAYGLLLNIEATQGGLSENSENNGGAYCIR